MIYTSFISGLEGWTIMFFNSFEFTAYYLNFGSLCLRAAAAASAEQDASTAYCPQNGLKILSVVNKHLLAQ